MENFKLKLELESSDTSAPLGVRVYFDNNCIFETGHVLETVKLDHNFDDVSGQHSFKLEMFGKLAEHTKLINGEIVKDALIEIKHLSIDDYNLEKILWNKGVYHHDYNGTQDSIDDTFFGRMGCNGSLELTFESPFYIWLLENM